MNSGYYEELRAPPPPTGHGFEGSGRDSVRLRQGFSERPSPSEEKGEEGEASPERRRGSEAFAFKSEEGTRM